MKQMIDSVAVVTAVSAVAGVVVIGAVLWQNKKRKANVMPSKWTKVGEVSELIFYPLKGGRRVCVKEAQATALGLKEPDKLDRISLQDRVFIVIDENNGFLNGKKKPQLMLISTTTVDKTKIKFSHPNAEDLIVEIPDENNSCQNFLLYGDRMQAVDCGERAATWFSQILLGKSTGLKLGCYLQSVNSTRSIEGDFSKSLAKVYTKFCSEYTGAYADVASYMLISEESIKDLNSRLETPVNEHHFRPNIIVKGSPAYSEDSWDWLKIGDSVVLRGFKHCTRCVVTTINPDTAERNPSFEPMKTLRKYRLVKEPKLRKFEGEAPVLGLYAGCHQTGTVKVGDPVFIGAE